MQQYNDFLPESTDHDHTKQLVQTINGKTHIYNQADPGLLFMAQQEVIKTIRILLERVDVLEKKAEVLAEEVKRLKSPNAGEISLFVND
jgi:hypothetical protein